MRINEVFGGSKSKERTGKYFFNDPTHKPANFHLLSNQNKRAKNVNENEKMSYTKFWKRQNQSELRKMAYIHFANTSNTLVASSPIHSAMTLASNTELHQHQQQWALWKTTGRILQSIRTANTLSSALSRQTCYCGDVKVGHWEKRFWKS